MAKKELPAKLQARRKAARIAAFKAKVAKQKRAPVREVADGFEPAPQKKPPPR